MTHKDYIWSLFGKRKVFIVESIFCFVIMPINKTKKSHASLLKERKQFVFYCGASTVLS